ncbi:zinc knuckle CX2CX4HX4C containing protein [Tanacetum coccineum]
MESSNNLNKGEGLAGGSKVDDLRAFMQKLQVDTTRAIGVFQNPNASFKGSSNPEVSRAVGRGTDMHTNPNMDSTPEGDHITVSLGESTNPSLPTMNPSKDHNMATDDVFWSNSSSKAQYPKPFEYFGGTKDVPSLNQVNEHPGVSTNMSSFLSSNYPTGGTLGDQTELPTETSSETPIVQSVEINTKPTSYVEATGVLKKEKHGLKRITMNAKGFVFFKFDTRAGLEAVLEGGPWMVRNYLIILKKWSMKTSLQKEELTCIPIWVKLHDVPIQVFEEDVISLIATYLGKPIMLDSYTSSMCKDS